MVALTFALSMIMGILVNVNATKSGSYSYSYTELQELIIKNIFSTYMSDQSNTEDVKELISLLKKTDEELGEAYEDMMDYWNTAITSMTINKYNPDGNSSLPTMNVSDDSKLCIVILGYALNDDGSMKDELIGRLKTGYALAEKYPNAKIAVTGGGIAKNNSSVTEGGAMVDYLINTLGVDESRIIVEDEAKNTAGNALNTLKILNNNYSNITDLIMVTSDYHIARGCTFFNSVSELYEYDTGKSYTIVDNLGYYTGKSTESVNSMLYGQMYTIADIDSPKMGRP